MHRDIEVGNAFLDVALVGILLTAVGIVIDLMRGGGVELVPLGLCAVLSVAYVIGSLRVGSSPIGYLRTVAHRGSLPR